MTKGVVVMVGGLVALLALGIGDAEARRGRGGHGGHGHHGGHGGGTVSAPSVSAPAAGATTDGGALTQGYTQDQTGPVSGQGAQLRTEADTKLALERAGHYGLVQVNRINVDGSFTYSGYEWAVVAFAREMKGLGYNMGSLGEASTDFAGPSAMSLGDLVAP